MLRYRAGVFLIRLYAGGALGGMYMREEMEDIVARQPCVVTPPKADPKVEALPAPAPPQPPTAQIEVVVLNADLAYASITSGNSIGNITSDPQFRCV
jgi:hypothetical protein